MAMTHKPNGPDTEYPLSTCIYKNCMFHKVDKSQASLFHSLIFKIHSEKE